MSSGYKNEVAIFLHWIFFNQVINFITSTWSTLCMSLHHPLCYYSHLSSHGTGFLIGLAASGPHLSLCILYKATSVILTKPSSPHGTVLPQHPTKKQQRFQCVLQCFPNLVISMRMSMVLFHPYNYLMFFSNSTNLSCYHL